MQLGLDGGAARVSGTTLSDLGLDVSGEGGPLPTVHEAPNEGAASHKKPEVRLHRLEPLIWSP